MRDSDFTHLFFVIGDWDGTHSSSQITESDLSSSDWTRTSESNFSMLDKEFSFPFIKRTVRFVILAYACIKGIREQSKDKLSFDAEFESCSEQYL